MYDGYYLVNNYYDIVRKRHKIIYFCHRLGECWTEFTEDGTIIYHNNDVPDSDELFCGILLTMRNP